MPGSHPALYPAQPHQTDTGETLESGGSGRRRRKGDVCDEVNRKSPRENQNSFILLSAEF